jgi:predicted O-methyltransferase YrrM
MRFEDVAANVDGIPNMTRSRARRVYDHLRSTASVDVLELGTAHGVSAAYMAAAVEENGGSVTTVDHVVATRLRDPQPDAVLARAGLTERVNRVLVQDSSYTWWLGQRILECTRAGRCEPGYDFVYIDGAHNWTIDGFSFFLVEKLLRPGGWILLDDMAWSYGASTSSFGPGQGPDALGLSSGERSVPHIKLVFDLLVAQHPSLSNFLVEDEDWGWAQKTESGSPIVRRESTAGWKERVGGALRGVGRR